MPQVTFDDMTRETISSKSVPLWSSTDDYLEHRIPPVSGWVTSPVVWHLLHLQIRKVNRFTGERTKLEKADKCAIVDFPPSSIFKQTEVYFNDYRVSTNSCDEMYHHYLRARLEFPEKVRRTLLSHATLWCPDSPHHFDSFDAGENQGYNLRHAPFLNDHVVELYAPLMMDIFRQSQPFPDDVDIRIRMQLNNVRLCINGSPPKDHTYELGILKSNLCITRHHPISRYRIGDALSFPTKTVDVMHFFIAQGPANLTVDIHEGAFPDRLTLLMLTQEAFIGAFERNAFNFITNNVKYAQIVVHNTIALPPDGYQLDMTTLDDRTDANAVWFPARYVKTYLECMQTLMPQASLLEVQAPVAYNAFTAGSFMLSWQLHHGKAAKRAHGPIRFVAELHQPLAAPTVLLFLFHYERTVISRANGTVDFR